jgi:hypothetical protein
MKIARLLVVIEDDFLIKVREFGHDSETRLLRRVP